MNKLDCTVIGDAMIDITLPLPDVKALDNLLHGGVINTEYKMSPGGTANIAVGISKLGGKSAFIGEVGDDYFGEIFIKDLEANEVLNGVSISKTKRTGIAFTLVLPGGERYFIVDRGANTSLLFEDIDLQLIQNSSFIYFTGFSLQERDTSQTIQKVIEEASKKRVAIVFNPGAPNLAEEFRDTFLNTIRRYVDMLILNNSEGRYLAGCDRESEIMRFLLSQDLKRVVLTMGNRGSIVATKDKMYQIDAHALKVVDTTGAGDAYAAGFIYGLIKGWKEETAGKFASKIAGEIVGQIGPRFIVR